MALNCLLKLVSPAIRGQWPVSRKSRRRFGPKKPFLKLRNANSAKVIFSYAVKGKHLKKTAKFRASRRLRFEDTKRIVSPETRPKSFGTFVKQVPGFYLSSIHDTRDDPYPELNEPILGARSMFRGDPI